MPTPPSGASDGSKAEETRDPSAGASEGVAIDHLLVASRNLDRGAAWLESLLGVPPETGGVHPGLGTRNAVLSIGPSVYLELIGLDPSSDAWSVWAERVSSFEDPGLFTFCVRSVRLERTAEAAEVSGLAAGKIVAGSRETPSGEVLEWRMLFLQNHGFGAAMPFFIDWGATPHPTSRMEACCSLTGFQVGHPDPEGLRAAFGVLEIPVDVERTTETKFHAILESPAGRVELRSESPGPDLGGPHGPLTKEG